MGFYPKIFDQFFSMIDLNQVTYMEGMSLCTTFYKIDPFLQNPGCSPVIIPLKYN